MRDWLLFSYCAGAAASISPLAHQLASDAKGCMLMEGPQIATCSGILARPKHHEWASIITCLNRAYAMASGYGFYHLSSPALSVKPLGWFSGNASLDGHGTGFGLEPEQEQRMAMACERAGATQPVVWDMATSPTAELNARVEEGGPRGTISALAGTKSVVEKGCHGQEKEMRPFKRSREWCKVALLAEAVVAMTACSWIAFLDSDALLIDAFDPASANAGPDDMGHLKKPVLHKQPPMERFLNNPDRHVFMGSEIKGQWHGNSDEGPHRAQGRVQHSTDLIVVKPTATALNVLRHWWCASELRCDPAKQGPGCYRSVAPNERRMASALARSKKHGSALLTGRNPTNYNTLQGRFLQHYAFASKLQRDEERPEYKQRHKALLDLIARNRHRILLTLESIIREGGFSAPRLVAGVLGSPNSSKTPVDGADGECKALATGTAPAWLVTSTSAQAYYTAYEHHNIWEDMRGGRVQTPLWLFHENSWEVQHGRRGISDAELRIAACATDIFDAEPWLRRLMVHEGAIDAFYRFAGHMEPCDQPLRLKSGKLLVRKMASIWHALKRSPDETVVIWADTDVTVRRPPDEAFFAFVRRFAISYIPFTTNQQWGKPPVVNFVDKHSPYWRIESGLVAATKKGLPLFEQVVNLYRGGLLERVKACLDPANTLSICKEPYFMRNTYLDDIFVFSLVLHENKHNASMPQGWFSNGCGQQWPSHCQPKAYDQCISLLRLVPGANGVFPWYHFPHVCPSQTDYASPFNLQQYFVHHIGSGAYSRSYRQMRAKVDTELTFSAEERFNQTVMLRFPGSSLHLLKEEFWSKGSLAAAGKWNNRPCRDRKNKNRNAMCKQGRAASSKGAGTQGQV